MTSIPDITADAVALQERDEFRAAGWLKLIAPAKVNLHLAIGARRDDGYHQAVSVMHAINLHDVVYARRIPENAWRPTGSEVATGPSANTSSIGNADEAPAGAGGCAADAGAADAGASGVGAAGSAGSAGAADAWPVIVRMVACGDVEIPDIDPQNNIAARAVRALGVRDVELRIEKNIPVEGGLGGGSTDAAAALLAAAALAGMAPDDPAIEQAARSLGADVAFFLHGGCAVLGGAGDEFVRALEPSKRAIALVKPAGGVSTAAAYRTFDEDPSPVPEHASENVAGAQRAEDIMPFNNLAAASERLAPELAEVRSWLAGQPGVEDALLCGSGATTFAVCTDFNAACQVVAGARRRGWWARATSFGSARAMLVSGSRAGADTGPVAGVGTNAGPARAMPVSGSNAGTGTGPMTGDGANIGPSASAGADFKIGSEALMDASRVSNSDAGTDAAR